MPTQDQRVEFPFIAGIDTKTDPLQLPNGRLAELRNAGFGTPGAVTKRAASRLLTRTVIDPVATYPNRVINRAYSLHGAGDTLLLAGTSKIKGTVQSPSGPEMYARAGDRWVRAGCHAPVSVDVVNVASSSLNSRSPSVAVLGELALVVWGDSTNGPKYSLIRWRDGAKIIDQNLMSGAVDNAKVTTQGTSFAVYGKQAGSANILKRTITTDPLGTISSSTPFTDAHADELLDVCAVTRKGSPEIGNHFIAYKESSGSAGLLLKRVNASGTVTHTYTTETPTSAVNCFPVFDGTNDLIVLVWYRTATNTIRYVVVNADDMTAAGVTETAPVNVDGQYRGATGSNFPMDDTVAGVRRAQVLLDRQYDNGVDVRERITQVVFNASDGTTASNPVQTEAQDVNLAGCAFVHDGQGYFVCSNEDDYQSSYFVAGGLGSLDSALSSGSYLTRTHTMPVAKVLTNRGDGRPAKRGFFSAVFEPEPGVFVWAANRRDRSANDGAVSKSAVLVITRFGKQGPSALRVGDVVHGGGGYTWQYDGRLAEAGFHLYPPIPEYVSQAAGGGGQTDGVYLYRTVLEWIDRAGNKHRSAPSEPLTVTLTGGGSTQLANLELTSICMIASTKLTSAVVSGEAVLALYRTKVNLTTFYKVTELDTLGPLDSVAYADTMADSALEDNEQLYATGGKIENRGPPATDSMTLNGARLFVAAADEFGRVWESKRKSSGEGVAFAGELFVDALPGGPVTAVGMINASQIVFGESTIEAFSGEGHNDLGQGGFSTPQRISTDAGCVRRNPIVETNHGIFFKSHKGIYLLDQSLQTSYIGAPVEAFNRHNVIAAALDGQRNRVLFALDDAATVLAYDYAVQAWDVYDTPGLVAAAVTSAGLVWARASGEIFEETNEGADEHPLRLKTGPLRTAGIQGFQRVKWVYLLGRFTGPTKIKVTLEATDDADQASTQSVTATLKAGPQSIRIKPKVQKCAGLQVTIDEIDTGKRPLPFALSGLRLICGVKSKKPLPPSVTL